MRRALMAVGGGLAILGGTLASASGSASTVSFSGYTWHLHDGTGGQGQRWSASHVKVSGGVLSIAVSGGVGGGVSMPTLNRTYGSYAVRFRMSRGGGKFVILLWPKSGSRPEIDFAEDSPTDSARTGITGTFHPKPGCTGCIQVRTRGDFQVWHTAGLVWRSSGLTLTLDGRVWGRIAQTSHVPMHLAIQANCVPGQGSCSTGSVLQVSSVKLGS